MSRARVISRMLFGTYPASPPAFLTFHHCFLSSSTWGRNADAQLDVYFTSRKTISLFVKISKLSGLEPRRALDPCPCYLHDLVLDHRQLRVVPRHEVVLGFGVGLWLARAVSFVAPARRENSARRQTGREPRGAPRTYAAAFVSHGGRWVKSENVHFNRVNCQTL